NRAHQADGAAAVDESDMVLCEDFAERLRCLDEAGVCARAGAAIDTNSLDLVHMSHVALQRRSVKTSGFVLSRKFPRKYPESRKNHLQKAVRRAQSLYMTGRMQPDEQERGRRGVRR